MSCTKLSSATARRRRGLMPRCTIGHLTFLTGAPAGRARREPPRARRWKSYFWVFEEAACRPIFRPGVYVEEVDGRVAADRGRGHRGRRVRGPGRRRGRSTSRRWCPTGPSSPRTSGTSSRAPTSPTPSTATSSTAAATASSCASARNGSNGGGQAASARPKAAGGRPRRPSSAASPRQAIGRAAEHRSRSSVEVADPERRVPARGRVQARRQGRRQAAARPSTTSPPSAATTTSPRRSTPHSKLDHHRGGRQRQRA